jgi:hypothetical protein
VRKADHQPAAIRRLVEEIATPVYEQCRGLVNVNEST